MTACGKRWGEMDDAKRQKFLELNAKDKVRQDKQLAELKNKGFFVLEDGSKSSDEQNAPKQSRKAKKANKSLLMSADEVTATRKPIKKVAEK